MLSGTVQTFEIVRLQQERYPYERNHPQMGFIS
jgi:hypothetical protein